MPIPVRAEGSGHQDLGLQRLTFAEIFPAVGMPVNVSRPVHRGDLPLHDHDFVELALVTGGHAVHRTIHGQAAIGRGACFLIHPGQWHAYEQARELVVYNCCFGTDLLLRELAWVRVDPLLSALFPGRLASAEDARARRAADQGVLTLGVPEEEVDPLVRDLEALRALQAAPDQVRVRGDVVARLLLVLGRVGRLATVGQRLQPAGELAAGPIADAVLALEERLEREWSLDELADLAGLNRSYFVRRFKRATGLSPMAYLARRRAEKAAVLLLTTDRPIAAIGKQVGWRDPNYFARRFRHAFGMSARAYREQLPTPPLARPGEDVIRW
jgi:AraC family L-rhamnose operon transcriptional activator RhaR